MILSEKLRAVLTTIRRTSPPTKITVIFLFAYAIRKFQKAEPDKYKKSLSHYFDKQAALDELDEAFAQGHFIKLVYFIRKFDLTFQDLSSIVNGIFQYIRDAGINSNADEKNIHFLILALKHLTQNTSNESNPLEISWIAELIETYANAIIKNELIALLMFRYEQLNAVSRNQSLELEATIRNLPDIKQDTKALLLGQLESNKTIDEISQNKHVRTSKAIRKVKKNQQVVSKTIQTVKAKQESKRSEEADFTLLNLSDCLKNRNRRVNCNTVLENLEPTENEKGSDRSMWRTTWGETINLFSLVSQGQLLKDDDKDTYLPKKFLGYHYFKETFFNGEAAKVYSFLINRMCASIFFKISKKQQLNDIAIDQLLKCITDFENMVTILKLDQDFVKMFVDKIFNRYWDLKALTNPDIVVKFVKNVMHKTTEEYKDRGWFSSSIKVRQKSYDRSDIEQIVSAEINCVRLDAIKAFYNCAIRDRNAVLTEHRQGPIRSCARRLDERDKTFTDYVFKLLELAEPRNDFNYIETFAIYLNRLNAQSTNNVDAVLRFFNNQARDLKRSQQLFNDHVIAKLIGLVGKDSCFSSKQKVDVIEIINTCLEHQAAESLSDNNMETLLNNCFESNDTDLMYSGKTSLLLCTDKTRSLSRNILEKLMTNFDLSVNDEELTSYIVFILSRAICNGEHFLDDPRYVESVSSKMLCDHVVEFNADDDGVRFEKQSEKNDYNSSNQISLLASQIVLKSIENRVLLSSVTIDNLLLILNSNEDKQTKIIASKCLYKLTKYMRFKDEDLNQLLDVIDNPIYDVSVYIQTAYLRSCAKVAGAPLPSRLDSNHLENISALYVPESLKLGLNDYEKEINKNLFITLLYEARKQQFHDQNIFLLFNSVLNSNGKYACQVLAILFAYTNNYPVPESTIRTLEYLTVACHIEKALLVLKNLILGGQSVTRKTLMIFIDDLCLSANSRLRFYSFKLLEKVSQNQELPDDIFFKFELVRAGYALENKSNDKEIIIKFISNLTDKGYHLPIDTKLALEKEINHIGVLKIFAQVSKNKQIIDQTFINNFLIKLFDPETISNHINESLITIFENAVKNNQTLPQSLLDKLEKAFLNRKDLEQNILPIFIYLAQKGEKLSQHVNEKLIDQICRGEQDPVLKQELLSSLGSLIDANKEEINLYLTKVNKTLLIQIESDNFNIQKLCIATIAKLVVITGRITENLLQKVVAIGTELNCNKVIRNEIQSLFDSIDDDRNPSIRHKFYREKIKLANLNCDTDQHLLRQLSDHKNGGLLLQNYKQLKNLIDNGSVESQKEALNLLNNYKFKDQITDELLESIAILYESTMSDWIKNSSLKLLDDVVQCGKTLFGRADQIWKANANRDEILNKFFQTPVCNDIKTELELSDQVLIDVLKLIDLSKRISDVSDLIRLVVEENPDYFESKSFVMLIERCLIKKKILCIVLPCYCRIIKEEKSCNVQECLQSLVQDFDSDDFLADRLFEIMYYANKFKQLHDDFTKLAVNNVDNSSEIIRGYSFGILRTLKDKYQHEKYLDAWSNLMLESLANNIQIDIKKSKDYLDLLEIVVSLRFLDVSVFTNNKREIWKRELLVSSIFETFKVFHIDQIDFYTRWFSVEEKLNYHKSCKVLSLIQKSDFDSFSQIVELILMILELPFDEVIQMMSIFGPKPYEAFKQSWCDRKIQLCMKGIDTKYSRKLAIKLCLNFDVNIIGKLFSCLISIDNVSAFEYIVDFCSKEKFNLNNVLQDCKKFQLNDLRRLIEAKHLCKCAKSKPKSEAEEKDFLKILLSLNNAGWNFTHLCQLVTEKPLDRFRDLLNFLNTVRLYGLSNYEKIRECVIGTKSFREIIQKLSKHAIDNYFQLEGKVKDFNELMADLKKNNGSNSDLLELIKSGYLNIKANVFDQHSAKLEWNEKQIYLWAKTIKIEKIEFSDYEAIAVILRANFLVTGHTLTDPQMLCSLIALSRGKRDFKGKLLQVATGEGKSTIICILAIIKALRGKQVDVITSSPVLAERDAKQKAKLYRLFNLTCSDNNDKTVYLKGAKDCYKADIVYGEMSQFQFDILRDNYSKLGTLGERKLTIAIVDEVDSMLIDDSSKIARLSSIIPGMDRFQPIYVFIWQRLVSIKDRFIMFGKQLYFVNGKVGFEDGKITLEIFDNNNDVVKISDLEAYFRNNENISQVGEKVGDDIDGYLRTTLEQYLDCQIKENYICVPSNFAEFLQTQKSKWITNAIEALNYQENVHYVVKDGEIKPVDYYSTGIVQSSTSWSDGLHQFLQLKHNLKMTSETRTTNFLSNIGLINKYEQVYGLTGTLGSQTARKVLQDVYQIDLINIPQRHQKQFRELEAVIAQGEADWQKEIKSNIVLEIQKNRGILVICETIEHANRIAAMLKKKLRPSAIKLYTMNDLDQEKNVEKILPGQVIIATNLAGRGTDIQTDEIEVSGGLHVILTFMPSNQRVEDQAFGRTARQGKRGTGIMILNAQTTTMKSERDQIESNQLKEFKEKDLKLIQIKDKLFDKFCSFLNDEIRLKIRKKCISGVKQAVNWLVDVQPTTIECNVLAAVEEQWAGFLGKLDEGTIKCEDAENECSALICRLRTDLEQDCLIKNPYYYITIANDILVNMWSAAKSRAKQALEYFEKAIELDKNQCCSGAAHLGVGWCLILLQEEEYKYKALLSFKSALTCLSNEMSLLQTTQIILEQTQAGFVNSDLYKQLNVKATILGSYMNGVSSCIEAIKRSKRLINLVAVERHSNGEIRNRIKLYNLVAIETHSDGGIMDKIKYLVSANEHKDERIFKYFNELEIKGDLKLTRKEQYSLKFNHLTRREDAIDQALITLENAFDNKLLKEATTSSSKLKSIKAKLTSNSYNCLSVEKYHGIRINLTQINLERINNALFNPHKELKDLTGAVAIVKLKEERSYGHKLWLRSSYKANLTITSTDGSKLKEEYENKQINELIEIIEKTNGYDTLRFNITIKDANENNINKLFRSTEKRQVKFNINFDKLKQETALEKLSSIKAGSFGIEFVLNKSSLLKAIADNIELKYGTLRMDENNSFEKVDRQELIRRISDLKTDESPCYIKFEELLFDQAKTIIESCPINTLFGISFNDCDFYGSQLDDSQVNFIFDELDLNNTKMIIDVLRKENIEFALEFTDLSHEETRFILSHANMEQEQIEIKGVKNVGDLFMKSASPTVELNEFVSKGIEFMIQMSEKMFVPWRSVCAIAALGIGQVIFGGVLITTGFGSSVGMGLVTEGLADIFTAYRAYSNRHFNWTDYCSQKAVSLALSAATIGYSKWKDAAKGVQTLTTGAGMELLEQAGTQLITNRQAVGQTLLKTGANLKSLACKFVTVKATEAVAREGLSTGIQCLSNFSLDRLRPKICELIQSKVKASFCNTELMGYLRKMYAIDLATNSRQLQCRIEQIVAETVSPRHDFMRRQFDSIGLPLIKGILSDSSQYGSIASMSIRIIGTLNGLNQVQTLTNKVADALVRKLRSVDKNSMTMTVVFHRHLKIKKDNANVIVNKIKTLDIIDDSDNFSVFQSDLGDDCKKLKEKIDELGRNLIIESDNCLGEDVKKSIVFVKEFYARFVAINLDTFSMTIQSVSDQIAYQLIRIMDSQLMQPWSTLVVSSLTDSVYRRMQHYLVNKEQSSDSLNADEEKYQQLLQKGDLTPDEKAFMTSYGKFRTFAEQINYNSRDHCDTYMQCEMIYYAGQVGSTGDLPDMNVQQTADNVREGAAADLAVMITTAKINQVNLKIVDDKHYVKTQEDIDNDVQVMYVEHGLNDGIGHAYYMDTNGRFVEAEATGHDCFFAGFGKILETKGVVKSVYNLRAETAIRMESNRGNFSKVLAAENWIRKTHPELANNLLFTAGLYRDSKTGRIKVENEDVEGLLQSINQNDDKKAKRGGVHKALFKRKPKKKTAKNATGHHIIPNQLAEKIVCESFEKNKDNPDAFKELVENFVNKKHIRKLINKGIDSPKKQHGAILHAAVSWNPNNIVLGPLPKDRDKDPKSNLDEEILSQQPENYKSAIDKFKKESTFDNFANLPSPCQTGWRMLANGKYAVKEKKRKK